MEFIINLEDLPSGGKWCNFSKIILKDGIPMKDIAQLYGRPMEPNYGCDLAYFLKLLSAPTISPEPITKPQPTIQPRPREDDPFNIPLPAVDPTPKGFSFF